MNTGNLETRLLTVLRALFLLGVPTLGLGKLFLILVKEPGIAYDFTIREHHEGLETEISADRVVCLGQVGKVLFHQDADEVAISSVFRDSAIRRDSAIGQGARPHNVEGFAHFRKGESTIAPYKGRFGVFSRLAVTLLLEGRVLTTSLKEVDERAVEVTQGLLRRDTRDLIQPGVFILLLEVGQHRGEVFVVEAAMLLVVSIGLVAQAPIVDKAYTAKGASKIFCHLFLRK